METSAFKSGEHVILEMDDESMVAGFLVETWDEGWVLKVTHKEYRMVHAVSPEMKEDIREQLRGKSWAHLRVAALMSKSLLGLVGKKEDVVEFLAGLFEDRMLERYDSTMQLRELKAPVTTFVSHGVIRTMESTNDRNIMEELNVFDVDGAIEEIFKEGLTSEGEPAIIEEQEGERPST